MLPLQTGNVCCRLGLHTQHASAPAFALVNTRSCFFIILSPSYFALPSSSEDHFIMTTHSKGSTQHTLLRGITEPADGSVASLIIVTLANTTGIATCVHDFANTTDGRKEQVAGEG